MDFSILAAGVSHKKRLKMVASQEDGVMLCPEHCGKRHGEDQDGDERLHPHASRAAWGGQREPLGNEVRGKTERAPRPLRAA